MNVLRPLSRPLCAALILAGASCQAAPGPEPSPPADGAQQRLSLDEARQRVRRHVSTVKPRMNPAVRFPLQELTTDEVWDRLGVQVFQVTADVMQCATFVLRGDEVWSIGVGVGGWGVNSLGVAPWGPGGSPVLVYSYSWGSGIHRSRLAYATLGADGLQEHLAPEVCYLMDDWVVRTHRTGRVDVLLRGQVIGQLVLPERQDTPALRLRPGLPEAVAGSIRTPQQEG